MEKKVENQQNREQLNILDVSDNMKNIEDLVDFGFFINENTIK